MNQYGTDGATINRYYSISFIMSMVSVSLILKYFINYFRFIFAYMIIYFQEIIILLQNLLKSNTIIIKSRRTKSMKHCILTFWLFVYIKCGDYITNGGFEIPYLPSGVQSSGLANWIGQYDLKASNYPTSFGFGQYIDLQRSIGQNGFLQQSIVLPLNGTYLLQYYQKAYNTNYHSFALQIYWNSVLQAIKTVNSMVATQENLTFYGHSGINTLEIRQVGDDFDHFGMQIDEFTLDLIAVDNTTINTTASDDSTTVNFANTTNITNISSILPINEQTTLGLSIILSFPLNQLTSFKYAVFFVDDLWLYYYDNRTYKNVINDIFVTIAKLQCLKFKVFEHAVNLTFLEDALPVSDYTQFTRNRFIEIQGSQQTLIKAAFPYFFYTIPLNIGMCLLLYFFFRLLYRFKVSLFIRRFYFFGVALLQILLEGNIPYFVYLCFGNIVIGFNFSFADKLSTIFTIIFFFLLLLFTLTFYFMTGRYLQKQACYFIYCFYRSFPSYCFLTVNNLVRGFLRGSIHYFLYNYYFSEILCLCAVEVIVIAYTIIFEKNQQIFITKSMFLLYLTYHFLFILLNISLYLEYKLQNEQKNTEIFLDIQNIIVYLLLSNGGLMMILDLIPFDYLKTKDKFQQQIQNFGNSAITMEIVGITTSDIATTHQSMNIPIQKQTSKYSNRQKNKQTQQKINPNRKPIILTIIFQNQPQEEQIPELKIYKNEKIQQ